jgi:hypothetical protein
LPDAFVFPLLEIPEIAPQAAVGLPLVAKATGSPLIAPPLASVTVTVSVAVATVSAGTLLLLEVRVIEDAVGVL